MATTLFLLLVLGTVFWSQWMFGVGSLRRQGDCLGQRGGDVTAGEAGLTARIRLFREPFLLAVVALVTMSNVLPAIGYSVFAPARRWLRRRRG